MALWGNGAQVLTVTNTVTSAETVAVTLPPTVVPRDSVAVLIFGVVNGTPAAGSTQFNLRLRRGPTVTDTLVGNLLADLSAITAGFSKTEALFVVDTLISFGTVQYCITAQFVGAGSNCTINTAAMGVIFLS